MFTDQRPRIEPDVIGVLDSLACRPNLGLLADRVTAADGLRAWSRLVCNDDFDAWLIAWGAWSGVAAHDHGDSTGAIRVVRGTLAEAYLERETWRERPVRAGRSIVVPAGRVHGVSNPAARLAVSLHVYSPPLQQMNFFPDAKQVEVTG